MKAWHPFLSVFRGYERNFKPMISSSRRHRSGGERAAVMNCIDRPREMVRYISQQIAIE
jgi:hypothetical protein